MPGLNCAVGCIADRGCTESEQERCVRAPASEASRVERAQVDVLLAVELSQQTVDVRGMRATDVCDEERDELGRHVVVRRVGRVCSEAAQARSLRARLVRACLRADLEVGRLAVRQDGRGREQQVVVVRVGREDGRELRNARAYDEGHGMVLCGQRDGERAGGREKSPVGHHGVRADDDLVDARHEGEHGRVGDERGVDAHLRQPARHLGALVRRRGVCHDHLEGTLRLGNSLEEGLDDFGLAESEDHLARVDVLGRLLGDGGDK
mmetsp:Transcript_33172/g.82551  ORF Transcript_33172/g.82551 Transcript_33172/m.82551 type:complete len:265 (-) Transcript_33172:545-1339(-)